MQTRWYELTIVSFLLVILGLLSTYPLVHYFDTAIPFGSFQAEINWNKSGDQLQLLYWFWLVKENLLGNVPFDTDPYEFIMPVQHATTGLNTFPFSVLYTLFSPFGDVAAYNCTIISSYILSGFFMYLLVRLYKGNRLGAFLAAVIFTYAPSRINGIAGGNIYGFLFFCYPWTIYFLEKGIRARQIRYGVLSALGIVLLSILEPHLLYYLLLFFAVYFPFRFVLLNSLTPETAIEEKRNSCKSFFFTIPALVFFIWGAGLVAVFYSQFVFAFRAHNELITRSSLWVLTTYPLLLLFGGIWFSMLLQRLTALNFRRCLTCTAFMVSPLYFSLFLCLPTVLGKPIPTKYIVSFLLLATSLCGLIFLRKLLRQILATLLAAFSKNKKQLYPIIPLILALAYVAFWLPKAKAEKLASTVAAGGRTLDDVRLWSAKISDIFASTNNVYLGKITFLILAGFLVTILFTILFKRRALRLPNNQCLITLFYTLTSFIGYILALGLAFGQSSLYLFLYNYLPYFKYIRISNRIMVMALFAASVASGMIVTAVIQKIDKKWLRLCVYFLLLALTAYQLIDFGIGKHMGITMLDRGQSTYSYIQEQRGKSILLELPLWPGDSHQSSLYQHYIMYDRIPRINGYSPLVKKEYIDTVFKPLSTLNRGILDAKQYDLLRQLRVGYITVHDNGDVFTKEISPFPPITTVRRLQNSPYLEQVQIDNFMFFKAGDLKRDNLFLFRVKNAAELTSLGNPQEHTY